MFKRLYSVSIITPLLLSSAAAQTPTTTVLRVSGPSVPLGQSVVLTATVAPASATGAVTFYDALTILGSARLSGGQAILTTPLLAFGTHSLHALYGGSSPFQKSASAAVQVRVNAVLGSGFTAPLAGRVVPRGGALTRLIGDFNADGKPDIVVAGWDYRYMNAGWVAVLLGNGDGGLRDPALIGPPVCGSASPFSPGPEVLLSGDFNQDGRTDLLAGCGAGGGAYEVFLGNGDGSFAPGSIVKIDHFSIALGDFNADGKADLVISAPADNNSTNLALWLLLGNGDGTFQTPAYIAQLPQESPNIYIADFNGDGKPDLATDDESSTVYVLLGNGDSTFQPPAATHLSNVYDLTFQDVNGDGKADMVKTYFDSCPLLDHLPCAVEVRPGHGDGTFGAPAVYDNNRAPGGDHVTHIHTVDFDGDGKVDLVVEDTNPGLDVLLGNGNGTFQPPVRYNGDYPADADFNGDGIADRVSIGNPAATEVSVSLGIRAQGAALLSIKAGSAQQVPIGQVFPTLLRVQVTDANLNPVSNAAVTFSAPSSGASGTFANGNPVAVVFTDSLGLATAPVFTANATLGTYAVIATASVQGTPTASAQFSLTNLGISLSSDSVTPNSGSGQSGVFAFSYSHSFGYSNLRQVFGSFNDSAFGHQGCSTYYLKDNNGLYLKNDTDDGWLGPLTPGAAGSVTNSRCTLDASGSSLSGSGATLTVTVKLSFKPIFAGVKGIYMYAIDSFGFTTPAREQRGSWTVTTSPPTSASVTPSSGSGSSGVFAFRYSSALGASISKTIAMTDGSDPSRPESRERCRTAAVRFAGTKGIYLYASTRPA
jgi:hypothetical protein